MLAWDMIGDRLKKWILGGLVVAVALAGFVAGYAIGVEDAQTAHNDTELEQDETPTPTPTDDWWNFSTHKCYDVNGTVATNESEIDHCD